MDSQSISDARNPRVSTAGPASEDTPADAETARRQQGVTEEVNKSAEGQGSPGEEKRPEVPFMVVALTYMSVLAVILLVVALIIFFW